MALAQAEGSGPFPFGRTSDTLCGAKFRLKEQIENGKSKGAKPVQRRTAASGSRRSGNDDD
jgi:hypothetical protein